MKKIIIGTILMIILPLETVVGYLLMDCLLPDYTPAYVLIAIIAFFAQFFQFFMFASIVISGCRELKIKKLL